MGVDQYASTHRFDALPRRRPHRAAERPADTAAVSAIRAHMRDIAAAFARGDFTTRGSCI
jgi:hypothetical protein